MRKKCEAHLFEKGRNFAFFDFSLHFARAIVLIYWIERTALVIDKIPVTFLGYFQLNSFFLGLTLFYFRCLFFRFTTILI
jgi:hypothetical protein